MVATSGKPNTWYGNQELMANKDALDPRPHMECEKHKQAVRGETSWAKVNFLFSVFMKSGSKSDDVLAAEGAFAFHTVKYHSSYKTRTPRLFSSATTY
jgi:hypothetical protein